jgi:hypothetical protein
MELHFEREEGDRGYRTEKRRKEDDRGKEREGENERMLFVG